MPAWASSGTVPSRSSSFEMCRLVLLFTRSNTLMASDCSTWPCSMALLMVPMLAASWSTLRRTVELSPRFWARSACRTSASFLRMAALADWLFSIPLGRSTWPRLRTASVAVSRPRRDAARASSTWDRACSGSWSPASKSVSTCSWRRVASSTFAATSSISWSLIWLEERPRLRRFMFSAKLLACSAAASPSARLPAFLVFLRSFWLCLRSFLASFLVSDWVFCARAAGAVPSAKARATVAVLAKSRSLIVDLADLELPSSNMEANCLSKVASGATGL